MMMDGKKRMLEEEEGKSEGGLRKRVESIEKP